MKTFVTTVAAAVFGMFMMGSALAGPTFSGRPVVTGAADGCKACCKDDCKKCCGEKCGDCCKKEATKGCCGTKCGK